MQKFRGVGRPDYALDQGGELTGRIHSKNMLLEGGYDGDDDARWVFAGSPNYNETSLRNNDEVLLRMNSRAIHDQYLSNFAEMVDAVQP